jgi:hypothetical protein
VPSRPVGGALSKNGVAPGVLFIGNLFPSASTAVIAASLDNTGGIFNTAGSPRDRLKCGEQADFVILPLPPSSMRSTSRECSSLVAALISAALLPALPCTRALAAGLKPAFTK